MMNRTEDATVLATKKTKLVKTVVAKTSGSSSHSLTHYLTLATSVLVFFVLLTFYFLHPKINLSSKIKGGEVK
jgi:hypothetical protein